MKTVTFSPTTELQLGYEALYTYTTDLLIGKSYMATKRFGFGKLKDNIRTAFPLVDDITLRQDGPGTVYVTMDFVDPTIIFHGPDGKVAAYESRLYPLSPGDMLWENTLTVEIPWYTSGYDSLDGILFSLDEETLASKVTMILDTLGEENLHTLIYMPGWEKFAVMYKNKQVYFSLNNEINIQLEKLIDIENNYKNFENLSVLDVGSIDDTIVR